MYHLPTKHCQVKRHCLSSVIVRFRDLFLWIYVIYWWAILILVLCIYEPIINKHRDQKFIDQQIVERVQKRDGQKEEEKERE